MRAGVSRAYIWTTDQVAAAAIETEDLADAAVTAAKLASAAVETTKIKDLAVTTGKIADLAITEVKIANDVITASKLNAVLTATRAKAYRSTVQSYNATTETKVQFDTEVFDPNSDYDNATNYRYTVHSGCSGQYVVHAHVTFGNQASDTQPRLEIFVNGVEVQRSFIHQVGGLGDITSEIMGILNLAAGDYVEIYVFSLPAGTILGDADRTYFEIFRLS